MAKFAEVIECLKNGGTASRQAWDVNGGMEVIKNTNGISS